MKQQLHPNEIPIRLPNENPDILTEAEELGTAYVAAWKEQNKRQNAAYLSKLEQSEIEDAYA